MKFFLCIAMIFSASCFACNDCQKEKMFSYFEEGIKLNSQGLSSSSLDALNKAYELADEYFKIEISAYRATIFFKEKLYDEAISDLISVFSYYKDEKSKPKIFYDSIYLLGHIYLLKDENSKLDELSEYIRNLPDNPYKFSYMYLSDNKYIVAGCRGANFYIDDSICKIVMKELTRIDFCDNENDYELSYIYDQSNNKVPCFFCIKPSKKIIEKINKFYLKSFTLFDCDKNCERAAFIPMFMAGGIPSIKARLAIMLVINELQYFCKNCCSEGLKDCSEFLWKYRPECNEDCDFFYNDL